MSEMVCKTATEAAGRRPTDWASLGARILAAAGRAAAMHTATVAQLEARDRRLRDRQDRDYSAEPDL